MKTDKNGCSTCETGEESYEIFKDCRGRKLIQYDYRHIDGSLFSCVSSSLEDCRNRKNAFINEKQFEFKF